jgi:hypothetical protein
MIAGVPNSRMLERIPIFSKRSVIFADKLIDLLYLTYGVEGVRQRREDLIHTLYTGSVEEVKNFIHKYNIDYFVIETYYYENVFFNDLSNSIAPLNRQTWSLLSHKGNKNTSFLLEFAKKNYDFILKVNNGDIFIVNSKKIMQKSLR